MSSTDDYLAVMERAMRAIIASPPPAAAAASAQRAQPANRVATFQPTSAAAAPSAPTSAEKANRVLQFIAQNRNPGTSRAYETGWRGFASYLLREGVAEDAISPWDVADYLRERVEVQGVAASTMGGDRAAIADKLKHTPLRDVVQHRVVAEMMAVLRTQAAPSRPKQHMSAELMREMLQTHEAAGPSGRANAWLKERDLFLMLLMMMAFLRESEAVALTRKDVLLKKLRVDGKERMVLHVYVQRSKTDQAGEGHVVLLGANDADPLCCPVRRFRRYCKVLDEHAGGADALFPRWTAARWLRALRAASCSARCARRTRRRRGRAAGRSAGATRTPTARTVCGAAESPRRARTASACSTSRSTDGGKASPCLATSAPRRPNSWPSPTAFWRPTRPSRRGTRFRRTLPMHCAQRERRAAAEE